MRDATKKGKRNMKTVLLSEEQKQKIMADWKDFAKDTLKGVRDAIRCFSSHLYLSPIEDEGDCLDRYSEKLSFQVGKGKKVIVVSLDLLSSDEYEGEFVGWGISLTALDKNGYGPNYHPYNYTPDCWVTDWETIKGRTDLGFSTLKQFSEEVLDFRGGLK
jgi:hypothetical protein